MPHKPETAEEYLNRSKTESHRHWNQEEVLTIDEAKYYAQLAVKEAREQDIKEMEESIGQEWDVVNNPKGYHPQDVLQAKRIYETTKKCISILESKLEGGE
jgi:hypothetical protein